VGGAFVIEHGHQNFECGKVLIKVFEHSVRFYFATSPTGSRYS